MGVIGVGVGLGIRDPRPPLHTALGGTRSTGRSGAPYALSCIGRGWQG